MSELTAGCRIAGRDVSGPDQLEVINPATGEPFATVAAGNLQNVEQAIATTVAISDDWAAVDAGQRSASLRGIAADLRAQVDELALLTTRETGKRLAESRAEVEFSANFFQWYADLINTVVADHRKHAQRRFIVRKRPVGPVGVLSPWNFPLSIPARKIAPALAAGCAVTFKPSELTPLTALELAKIIDRWIPQGVVNTVVGGPEVSAAVAGDPRLRGVSFTGSTRVGAIIAAQCAPQFTRLILELGGRAPFVVLEDADITAAVDALLVAKYRNNGASCIAANDVFVHHSRYDDFVSLFVERSLQLNIGDPMDEQTDLGPMINAGTVDRLAQLQQHASEQGLSVWQSEHLPGGGGYFAPAVVVGKPQLEAPWDEEIFGPIAPIRSFDSEAELVPILNSWQEGLGGYVCTTDMERALQFSERLEIGIVGINNGAPNTVEVPFGGFKHSGYGREGGVAGLEAFMESQTISMAI